MKRLVWLLLVILTAAGLTGGYFYSQSGGRGPIFRTAPAARGAIAATVQATGTLNAVVTVLVGSQVSGQVKALHADFNSQVKRNQVIARIDPETFEAKVNQGRAKVDASRAAVLNQRAALERARADLDNARAALAVARAQTAKAQVAVQDSRRDLGRKRELKEKGLIAQAEEDAAQAAHDSAGAQADATRAQEQAQESGVRAGEAQMKVVEAQLQSAQAQVVQTEAELRQAEVDLEHTIIRAPVDGVVVSRTVDVGQTVAASLQAPTLFTIAQDLAKMQVEVSVDEADVGRIRVGLRAAFTVDSFPGRTFTGQVMQIRKAAQVVQNVVTYTVVVSAANPELALLPGMTANVRVVTDRKEDVLKVANAALRFRPPGVEAERPTRGGPGGGRGAAPGDGVPGRVWILGKEGQPQPLTLRLGISDGSFTEVLSGDLADKQEVIVGLVPGQNRPAAPPPGPRMF